MTGVGTDRGDVVCEVVVVCGGMFAAVVARLAGVRVPIVPMSRALSTAQFSELMEWGVHYAATVYNLYLPLPGDPECPDLDSLPGVTEDEARAA